MRKKMWWAIGVVFVLMYVSSVLWAAEIEVSEDCVYYRTGDKIWYHCGIITDEQRAQDIEDYRRWIARVD